MLVLTRTKGQSVMIGNDVLVAVEDVDMARALLVVSRRACGSRLPFVDEVVRQWVRPTESIAVGPDVSCTLVVIDYGKVRLGFACPPKVKIHRTEIYEEICRQKAGDVGPPQSN